MSILSIRPVAPRPGKKRGGLSLGLTRALLSPVGVALRLIEWIADASGTTNRLNRRNDREFGRGLPNSVPFIFFGGAEGNLEKMPADEYEGKRFFDDSRAVVSTPGLRLRFQKARGSVTVRATSSARPRDWEDVTTLLNWLDMQEGCPRQQYPYFDDSDWLKVDEFLRTNWKRLQQAVEAQEQ